MVPSLWFAGGILSFSPHALRRTAASVTWIAKKSGFDTCQPWLSQRTWRCCGLLPPAGFDLACWRASAAGAGVERRAESARRSSARSALAAKAPRRLAPTAGFGAVDVSSASEALFGGLASSLRCFIPTKEAEKSKHSSSSFRRGLSVVLASGPQNLGQGGGLLGQRRACV